MRNVCALLYIYTPYDGNIYKYMPCAIKLYTPFPELPYFLQKKIVGMTLGMAHVCYVG